MFSSFAIWNRNRNQITLDGINLLEFDWIWSHPTDSAALPPATEPSSDEITHLHLTILNHQHIFYLAGSSASPLDISNDFPASTFWSMTILHHWRKRSATRQWTPRAETAVGNTSLDFNLQCVWKSLSLPIWSICIHLRLSEATAAHSPPPAAGILQQCSAVSFTASMETRALPLPPGSWNCNQPKIRVNWRPASPWLKSWWPAPAPAPKQSGTA